MTSQNILQISDKMPFDSQGMTGYTMTTDSWERAIRLANMVIAGDAVVIQGAGFDVLPEDVKVKNMVEVSAKHGELMGFITIKDDATPVEFAEWSMALNHIGWFLHALNERGQISEIPVKVMFALWDKAHNHALDILKGDQLTEYLQLVD